MKIVNLSEAKTAFKHGSIARQLAWSYTLSTSAILIVASGFLYWVLITTLEEEDELFLARRIHILNTLLQKHTGETVELEHEIARECWVFWVSNPNLQPDTG